MALIEAEKLEQTYDGRRVLKEVSLQADRGEAFALIGATGAGKTTLLRLLDLLETPSSGTVYFDGVEVTHDRDKRLRARRRMSFVHQRPKVFTMDVYENVACGLKWRRQKGQVVRRKVDEALALVGMSACKDWNARTLSGGETQRVAIARALITDPEILLLDEPTANLDPASTAKIEQIIADVIRERETTVVMATHDMSQAQRLAGRIGILVEGEIPQVGSPQEIFCSPQSREVAEFVGVENMLSGTVVKRDDGLLTVAVNGTTVEAISDFSPGEAVYAMVRPEDITISIAREPTSARNVAEGTISRLSTAGALTRVEVDCGFPVLAVVTRSSAEDLELTAGANIYASFKATAVHVIRRWS